MYLVKNSSVLLIIKIAQKKKWKKNEASTQTFEMIDQTLNMIFLRYKSWMFIYWFHVIPQYIIISIKLFGQGNSWY